MSSNTSSPSPLTSFKRAVFNGARNLKRNLFLTVATLFVISLMLFVFNLVLAINFASESVIEQVGKKFDIRVELLEGVENYTIQTFVVDIEKQAGVEEVVYTNKNDALESLRERYPDVVSFVNYNELDNPLPDVVQIITETVEQNSQVLRYLEGPEFSQIIDQQKLINDTEQKTRNQKILDVTRFVQRSTFGLILIFVLVGLAIIFNSININIYSHQKEIAIMKLVGAKHWFIRMSYIIEGIFFGVTSLIISLVFSQLILVYLGANLTDLVINEVILAGINAIFVHFKENLLITFLWQLLAMVGVGALSSYLAIELYLRKNSE